MVDRLAGLLRQVEGQGLRLIIRRIEVWHIAAHCPEGWEHLLHLAWSLIFKGSAQGPEVSIDGVTVSATRRKHLFTYLHSIRVGNRKVPFRIQ